MFQFVAVVRCTCVNRIHFTACPARHCYTYAHTCTYTHTHMYIYVYAYVCIHLHITPELQEQQPPRVALLHAGFDVFQLTSAEELGSRCPRDGLLSCGREADAAAPLGAPETVSSHDCQML
jgi:hypothetical protein